MCSAHLPPKLVLFDLDGTLADTFKDLLGALNLALAEHGYGNAQAERIRGLVSHGARAMARAGLPSGSADLDSVHQRLLAIYERDVALRTTLFNGIEPLLDTLDRVGIRYGVVTNKQSRFSERLIDSLRLRSRLCCLVSGDTATRAKPHADPLLLAADLCGVTAKQCVYIGDARNDVLAARAANMCVAVATYGYIGDNDEPQSWNADALIAHPSDLHNWLQLTARV